MSNSGASQDQVRAWDRPRYYASLFAAPRERIDLQALLAFGAELAAVPGRVSEPGLGEIRLQWWRDALERLARDGTPETPLQANLSTLLVEKGLPVAPFLAMIDAVQGDLHSDPPDTMTDLEGYLGETESALFHLAALRLGGPHAVNADLSGHGGVAYGLTRHLARFALERRGGRVLVPRDVLAQFNLSPGDLYVQDPPPAIAPAIATLAAAAGAHLEAARGHLKTAERSLLPAYLPLVTVQPLLDRIAGLGARLADEVADRSAFGTLCRMLAASGRARIGRPIL